MSYRISGTSITLTRGDSFLARIEIANADGSPYTPFEGDSIRFAMKARLEDPEPLLLVDIPTDDMLLVLRPEDTKELPFGKYVYDIQLTKADGEVDTFITASAFKLAEEVF